jgi:tetraacyldisaccharide 4'-kinase
MRWTLWLFPFAVLYDAITRLRNHLYNIGSKPSFSFEANVIAVGNLSVGGTGKSPMVNYLIDHFLNKKMKIATLSRGYGRKTKGFLMATEADNAKTIGDEPAMYLKRYQKEIAVSVCENRALAIPQILATAPDNDVILLDDAFQHRSVVPSFSILLTTYQSPFYNDLVLPAGRLREARKGSGRADAIVVTKCPPSLQSETVSTMERQISKYAHDVPVFFTSIAYGGLVPLSIDHTSQKVKRVLAVAGIAHDASFFEYLRSEFDWVETRSFRDHKEYSKDEITQLDELAKELEAAIVLTEKDATKWRPFLEFIHSSVYYLPIETSFLDKESEFLALVDSSIEKYNRDY